jgi:hypothetical protein
VYCRRQLLERYVSLLIDMKLVYCRRQLLERYVSLDTLSSSSPPPPLISVLIRISSIQMDEPYFKDAVVGGFVKLSIGMSDGQQKYVDYTLHSLCTALTMHCTHYALHSLCTALTMHCTHYALHSLCTLSL